MKNKTTHERMFDFIAVAQMWLAKDKGHIDTKLGYAIQRTFDRLKKPQQKFQSRRDEIHIDTCLTDEKGRILRTDRGEFEYTKEGLKERNLKVQSLFEAEIEVEPYYAREIPDGLTFAEKEAFNGFVLLGNPESEQVNETEIQQTSVQ